MDLSLSDEQQMLKDSVARLVQEQTSIEHRREMRDTPDGFDRALYAQLAELGILALPFAEADGGFGGSAIDMIVVMEELGRGLALEPFLINVVLCGGLLQHGSADLKAAHLPQLIAGESQWAFAFAEANSRFDLNHVGVRATATADGFILNGEKTAVLNGHCADQLIVSVRTSGEDRDTQGVSLLVVDASTPGVQRTPYPLVDGTRGADISFNDVQVAADALIGDAGAAAALIEDVVAQALVAMGGEAVGAMDALLDETTEYARTREQFGQPIGKFQALQHRMADMYLHCQSMRSLLYYAAIARDEKRSDMLQAASGLKVKLGEAGRFVSQQAVQLHGGIGTTDELGVSHYFKRLLLLNTLFGDEQHHLQRYVELQA